ncbi:hypothetical protein RhiirC2_763929 [Rhizophagus irregularis]|uniref:Uncharacterized protein n=1 Tax=Rhizophagus irregularis TaxID=588596 RepID=A0A2N1M755_9GLOM|nr:hypothetical protein RhiirC2_763929 [Rhizophagus irregularis]
MGIVQVYVGKVLEKTPSLKDEMKELKDEMKELKAFVHEQAQKQAQEQSQMREDIQRLTDIFERLSADEKNENSQDIRIPTLNTIVLFRDEIKNIYEANKNILVQKELVDEANDGKDRSISQDTFADFIYGKSNISTKQNKNAMIYIYYTLKRFEALKARNS